MTIVFFSPRFYPQIGGVEKHAFEVARKLSKKHNITVITEGKKDKTEYIKGIKVIRLAFGKNNWFKKFRIWAKILRHKKLIGKTDIVHCHDVFFWYLPFRIIFPAKKVYVTFHGYETVFPPKSSAIFVRRLSEKLSAGNIAVGDYIEKWYGTKSEKVVYGAVDKVQFKKSKRKISKPKILFIGRVENDTGVKAYADVLKNLENFSFEVCGDGSLIYELKKFGLVHGFVSNLKSYILKADIVFASSYLSIMEGLSFKKSVFSMYENPLKRDYLMLSPFAKWIYISNSPKTTVNKINLILRNNKSMEKKREESYDWVMKQTWDKMTSEYLKLWKLK